MQIRQLTPRDLTSVLRIQALAYIPELIESADSFGAKLKLFPAGCLGVFNEDVLCAYVFSHPWHTDEYVPLDSRNATPATSVSCYYIHDLAVDPSCRGRGLAKMLLDQLLAIAAELRIRKFALVAVQDSESFWKHWGFRAVEKLTYGRGVPAARMVREEPGS